MAASITAKQTPAIAIPAGLPPMTRSADAPSAGAPMCSARRPTANSAGSPAPQISPPTTILASAERSIQLFIAMSLRSGRNRLAALGRRCDAARPLRVDIVGPDGRRARAHVDRTGDENEQCQDDDDPGVAADRVGEGVGAGADQAGGG